MVKNINDYIAKSMDILELSLEGIIIFDNYFKIIYVNSASSKLFGYSKDELLNLSVTSLLHKDFHHLIPEKIDNNISTGEVYMEKLFKNKQGNYLPCEINLKPYSMNNTIYGIAFIRDISENRLVETEMKLLNEKLIKEKEILQEISIKDPLTNLYNRRYVFARLKEEMEKHNMYNTSLSIIMFDLDGFKLVNDKHGHLYGDDVLKTISDFFKTTTRNSEIIARYGGDEFLILIPGSNIEKAKSIAERIRVDLEKLSFCDSDIKLTTSAGVIEYKGENEKDFLNKVDSLLYSAKKSGKNIIKVIE
ncbi:MAG: diguanylate cyclase [Clostridiaceae bacterium]